MPHHHHKHAFVEQPGSGETTIVAKAVAAGRKDHNGRSVSAEDIRLCAFRKWENAGKPTGDGVQFWLEAEQELVQRK